MKIRWQSIISIVFVVLLIILQIAYWVNPITVSDFIAIRDQLLHWIDIFPFISGCIYIATYTLSIVFGLPISTTVMGGYLFGKFNGFIYSLVAIIIGTISLCFFVRYVMRDWIKKRYADQLKPLSKEIDKYGIYYLFMIHLMPFMPSFLPHVAAGLSKIKLYKIILANIVASIPLTLIYTIAGSYIHTVNSWHQLLWYSVAFGAVLGLLFFAGMIFWRLFKNK